MAKFRKKPIVIEAVQVSALIAASPSSDAWPTWAREAFDAGMLSIGNHTVMVKTLEGEMVGTRADWIIRGVKGEIYPCKPDIFEATYEAVPPSALPWIETLRADSENTGRG